MDIVVKGRNVEVPEHFRVHVAEKLTRSERYDPKIIRVDVELSHETNRRQSKTCQRVQITLASRGPAIRAEASRDRDNLIRFCHWRQIERVIVTLTTTKADGTVH